MANQEKKITIAIAGGGIAGLSLAAGLSTKHKHLDFHIYEAAPAYLDVGAGLAIHLNGIKAMELINPNLRQAYADKGLLMGEEDQELATEVIMAQGPFKDELVAQLGKAKGRKTVSRADLLEGFSSLIPKDKITFKKRVESIEESDAGVKLTFKDGTTAQADMLIGADGIHSLARSYILGPDHPANKPVNHDSWHIHRTVFPMEEARAQGLSKKLESSVPILIGPRGYVHSMPLSKGQRFSGVVVVRTIFDENGNPSPLNPDEYADYNEDARIIVKLVAQNTIPWSVADHDHAPIYFRGRVAMVGDAAHATHAFNGQGAAQAIEDIAVLNHLFSRFTSLSQLEALYSAYDATRRPRSQRVVEISRQFGRIYAFSEGNLHEDLAELRKVMGAGGKYTNAFDLEKQNEHAMKLFEDALGKGDGVKVDV